MEICATCTKAKLGAPRSPARRRLYKVFGICENKRRISPPFDLFFNAVCAEAVQEDRHAALFRFLAGKVGTGDIAVLVSAFQQGAFHAQVVLDHVVHICYPPLFSHEYECVIFAVVRIRHTVICDYVNP